MLLHVVVNFLFLLLHRIQFNCTNMSHFIHYTIDENMSFYYLIIFNGATMRILQWVFVKHMCVFLLGIELKDELLVYKLYVYFSLLGTAKQHSKMVVSIYTSTCNLGSCLYIF